MISSRPVFFSGNKSFTPIVNLQFGWLMSGMPPAARIRSMHVCRISVIVPVSGGTKVCTPMPLTCTFFSLVISSPWMTSAPS